MTQDQDQIDAATTDLRRWIVQFPNVMATLLFAYQDSRDEIDRLRKVIAAVTADRDRLLDAKRTETDGG